MIIREATQEDSRGIADVQLSGWHWAYHGILPDTFLDAQEPQEKTRWWQERLPYTGEKICWVAEIDGKVTGFAIAGVARYDDREVNGELWSLYVHPEAARAGVGKVLWQTAHDFLKGQGYNGMYVMCLPDNVIGQGFYAKVGGEKLSGDYTVEFGGVTLPDTCFIWRF